MGVLKEKGVNNLHIINKTKQKVTALVLQLRRDPTREVIQLKISFGNERERGQVKLEWKKHRRTVGLLNKHNYANGGATP